MQNTFEYTAYDILPIAAAVISRKGNLTETVYKNAKFKDAFGENDDIIDKKCIDAVEREINKNVLEGKCDLEVPSKNGDSLYVELRYKVMDYERIFIVFENMTELRKNYNKLLEKEETLQKRVLRDPLSKLYNRETAVGMIEEHLSTIREYEKCYFIVLDLDNFKSINDTYGHIYGDAVITMAAGNIKNILGTHAIVGRFGGDEFFVYVVGITNVELEQKLESLKMALMRIQLDNGFDKGISCSIGIAKSFGKTTFEELFKKADSALYVAKKAGKNRYEYFDGNYVEKGTISYNSQKAEVSMVKINNYHTESEIALEIATKSHDADNAVINILRHFGIKLELDYIQVMRYDMVNDSVMLEHRWWRRQNNGYNVISSEKRTGYYVHSDLVKFKNKFLENPVFEYYPAFKENLSQKFKDVLSKEDGIDNIYAAYVTEKEEIFYAVSYRAFEKVHVWTKEELNDFAEITKIISMFMKSSNNISTREASLLRQIEYTPYGIYKKEKFYEEAGKIGRDTDDFNERMGVIHFDFQRMYNLNRYYGWFTAAKVLENFEMRLAATINERNISCHIEGTDQFITLFRYKDKDGIVPTIEKFMKEYCSEYDDEFKNPKVILKAGLCFFERGEPLANAIDTARNIKRGIEFDEPKCLTAEYIYDFGE